MAKKLYSAQGKISAVDITNDTISGRGGLFFFLRFVESIGFYNLIEKRFGFLNRSGKGLRLREFVKQILAYFVDGSDMGMVSFDRRKNDPAYAALLETSPGRLASSHQMKRFFQKLMVLTNPVYRRLLLYLFMWRLKVEKPNVIVLFADSKVFDNNDAQKREGVEPTYRDKRGYHPLHIIWNSYIVDAIFRSGSKHSNHGEDFVKVMRRLVRHIRKKYSQEVPIIVTSDSAFLDQDTFKVFEEELGIFYICVGKLYSDIKDYVKAHNLKDFSRLSNNRQTWCYVEFGNRLKSWSKFRRCIFTRLETEEDGQMLFDFAKSDQVIYTNIGLDKELTNKLIEAGGETYVQAETIIQMSHHRGKDELTHRALSEFATKEQFPFKRMAMNRAYYYFLVISHFLYEAYKQDMPEGIVSPCCYPDTFRRTVIDFAVKMVRRGRRIILKVTQAIWESLRIRELWQWLGQLEPVLCLRT